MATTFSVLVAGLGGQGILLVAKAIAATALRQHKYVYRTETRGLSQRGGAVCSVVRFGPVPVTPVVGPGGADVLLALDLLEAARALPLLKRDGRLVTNTQFVPPANLVQRWRAGDGGASSEEALRHRLRAVSGGHVNSYGADLQSLADQARCSRGLNVVLLGAASRFLLLPCAELREAVLYELKPQYRAANAAAFDLGRAAVLANPMPGCIDQTSAVAISA